MKMLLIISTLTVTLGLCAMEHEQPYTYRLAHLDDIPSLLTLINTQAVRDCDKIVILPERFRELALTDAITNKRIFVVEDEAHTIIAYKKLFIVSDKDELCSMLKNELRCDGTISADAGLLHVSTGLFIPDVNTVTHYPSSNTYLYDGADFTHPFFRGRGINKRLTETALNSVKEDVLTTINNQRSKELVLLYGLTKANAGQAPHQGRTTSIAQLFGSFVSSLFGQIHNPLKVRQNNLLALRRYDAYMPTFDHQSSDCVPLPDNQAVPGYGYTLSYALPLLFITNAVTNK